MPARLTEAELDAARPGLEAAGWTVAADGGSIAKSFRFGSFVEAFGFMTRAALWAEKLGHHPDWSNSYRTVAVSLTTHDASGLTELDLRLARKMDELAG